MKYIEISEGLSVRVDEIEAVTSGEDTLTSIVKTHHTSYRSTFPYRVLLELLEHMQEEPEDKMKQQELNILKQIGTFAG